MGKKRSALCCSSARAQTHKCEVLENQTVPVNNSRHLESLSSKVG